ncbi:MAG: ABC transporter ATP-binding protein [Gammaproteobacteria bacterium]
MTQETLLSVHNLTRSFDTNTAIRNLNFDIHRGEVVALLGTNGAGKSTTLNVITGNLKPDSGDVKICGIDIATKPKQAKNHLGYLPDIPPLYRELNVNEYLEFAARIHGVEKRQIKQSINEVNDTCGLHSVKHKLISNLSKGYQQRVGIAQAVIHHPSLVILDEPTIGLDPVQMQDIRTLLHELSNDHSVLLSTHMLSEAESTCDRVLIIDNGELLLDQALQELNKSPGKRVKLRFRSNPPVEELNSIAGCESVSCSQYGKFVCRYNDVSFIQQVQSKALQSDWKLYEIAPVASTLEQVFLDLVVRDSTTASRI